LESRVQQNPQTNGRDEKSFSAAKVLAPYLVLTAIVLAAVLPFASRAVYLDEPQYLHVAKSALTRDWRFPQDVPWVFYGREYPNLSPQAHPPVVEYYLAALLKLNGSFDERTFRLMYMVFPLLAAFSFYRLAKRFTSNPLAVACLFAVSPAFFVLSPTLMMDIPMLAFLLTGLSLYFDGRLLPASVFFILALGTGYTVAVPLGCLFLWAVATRRPWRECAAIAAAPAVIALWLGLMTLHYGELPTNELTRYYTSHFSFSQLIFPLFSFIGGVAFFPWAAVFWLERGTRMRAATVSILAASLLTVFRDWPSISYRLWFIFFAASGMLMIILFCVRASKSVGFLVLWFPATLLFFLLFAEMISARYLLLSLPPLFLVVFNRLSPKATYAVVAATVTLSVAISVGDYRFVNSYPRWIAENVVPLQRQGFRVWNAGEAGLRFYLQKEMADTLQSTDIRPRGAELVVKQESFRYGLSSDLAPLLVSILRTELRDDYPIRTFSRDAGAGFHDSHFGVVPYVISREPMDRIEIAEVSPFVVKLPQTVPPDFSSVPVWSPTGVILKQIESKMVFPTRIPSDTVAKYDLEGEGTATIDARGIVIEKRNPGPAVWHNFRIVPKSLLVRDDNE
jgi:hypothetical protein